MRKFLRAISSTILWSYERGSWPYDVMVAAIVLFVLITPRQWFHDRPQGATATSQGVILEAKDPSARIQTFRLDAALLGSAKHPGKPGPELEQRAHQLLSNSADGLKNRSFQIQNIRPIARDDGSVGYYEVRIKY